MLHILHLISLLTLRPDFSPAIVPPDYLCRHRQLDLFLSRNSNIFYYREFQSLYNRQAVSFAWKEEKRTDLDKTQQMKLMMFMERSRKDYLEAKADSDQVHKVEKIVTHMHETMVGMLEGKIVARVRNIEEQLVQYRDSVDKLHLNKTSSTSDRHVSLDMSAQQQNVDDGYRYGNDGVNLAHTHHGAQPCRRYTKPTTEASALVMVQESLPKWPAFLEGPRSALAMIKFGVEVQDKPLLIY